MSRDASELSIRLVDDVYGELTSLLFRILLCYGRLSVPALRRHTALSERLVKHGLSVLVQQQLVLWYTSDNNSTIYEANTAAAYTLVRSGKYVKTAEDQLNGFAGAVISNLLVLGHARVGDLVRAYGVENKQDGTSHDMRVNIQANGSKHATGHAKDQHVTLESIHGTLCELLRVGLVSSVNESHFRSDADNRIEVEKAVPSVEHFKAKSKRENEGKWEKSIKAKLNEWKYGTEVEMVESGNITKGKKRQLEDAERFWPEKRQRLYQSLTKEVIAMTGAGFQPRMVETGFLDENVILRVNHAKFAVIMRNNCLIDLADQSICTSTSKVYAKVLRAIEPRIRDCEIEVEDDVDMEPDLSSLPQISTDELVNAFKDSAELVNALGKAEASRIDLTQSDHPKKRRKKEVESDGDKMVDGDASTDEDEDGSDSGDDDSAISSESDAVDGAAEYNPSLLANNIFQDPHREAIRDHLLILARHPYKFLHHFPQTPVLPERWTVDYPPLAKNLAHHTVMQTITSRHGVMAARLTRILIKKGKVDEKNLCSISLLNQKSMRSYLASLHKAGMIQLQEVPRDGSRNPQRTMFLWFFDAERCKAKMLEETYKTMARCLQRARVEGDKVKGTVEKASRSDVIGKEEQFLAFQEREALERWKGVEERIWAEVGRLDDLVAVIRDF